MARVPHADLPVHPVVFSLLILAISLIIDHLKPIPFWQYPACGAGAVMSQWGQKEETHVGFYTYSFLVIAGFLHLGIFSASSLDKTQLLSGVDWYEMRLHIRKTPGS